MTAGLSLTGGGDRVFDESPGRRRLSYDKWRPQGFRMSGAPEWMQMDNTHVLVVIHDKDYMPPDVFGPFATVEEAQSFAEDYREKQDLPREATAENNDLWTNAGWYFGIVPLSK